MRKCWIGMDWSGVEVLDGGKWIESWIGFGN